MVNRDTTVELFSSSYLIEGYIDEVIRVRIIREEHTFLFFRIEI